MRCSKESVRKVIRLFLGLNDTPYCFHQTLTFKGDVLTDRKWARAHLDRLLNVLHKQHQMISLWTEEGHSKRRIHYHIVFLFYPARPATVADRNAAVAALFKTFRLEVFRHWYRITSGTVTRAANKMSLWAKGIKLLGYILGEAVPSETERERGKLLWHGHRNAKLIVANSRAVSKQEIRAAFNHFFPDLDLYKPMKFYNDWTKRGPQYYGKSKLRELRKSVEAKGSKWQKFKDGETRLKNCPDKDYMEWLNRKIDERENTI